MAPVPKWAKVLIAAIPVAKVAGGRVARPEHANPRYLPRLLRLDGDRSQESKNGSRDHDRQLHKHPVPRRYSVQIEMTTRRHGSITRRLSAERRGERPVALGGSARLGSSTPRRSARCAVTRHVRRPEGGLAG